MLEASPLLAALEDTHLIDVLEAGRPARTGCYVLVDEGITLIDPGSERGLGPLEDGLRALGISWKDVRHVVVTHVHLDHAGGVGAIAARAERAVVHCHPRGARHLSDPTRLLTGSRAVFGEDRLREVFGDITPVPAWRIAPARDLDPIQTGRHTLVAFDSPGHASHHATYLDERTGALYTGDAVGVRYDPAATGWSVPYLMPTTSPSEFDPLVSLETIRRLSGIGSVAVLHTHFAASSPETAFGAVSAGLEAYMALMERYGARVHDARDLQNILADWHAEDLARQRIADADPDLLRDDLYLNALGLYQWWQEETRRRAEKDGP